MGSATGNSMLGDMERNRLICQEMPVNQRSCLLQIRNDVRDLLNRLPEGGQDLSFIRKGDRISIPVPTGESGFGPPLIQELVL